MCCVSGLIGIHCGDPAGLSFSPSPAQLSGCSPGLLPQAVFATLPGNASFIISLGER